MSRRAAVRPPLAELEGALFELDQLVDLAWQCAPPESGYTPPWLVLVGPRVKQMRVAFDALCAERAKGAALRNGAAYTSCTVDRPESKGGQL